MYGVCREDGNRFKYVGRRNRRTYPLDARREIADDIVYIHDVNVVSNVDNVVII